MFYKDIYRTFWEIILITVMASNVIVDGQNFPIVWNDIGGRVIDLYSGSNVEFRNMNITNAAIHDTGTSQGDWRAIQIRAASPQISGITIRDSTFVGGGYNTILDEGATNVSIINCTISSGYNGYSAVSTGHNAIIQDCQFNNMAGEIFKFGYGSAYAPNIAIDNVNVTGMSNSAGFLIPNNATVTNCNIFGGVMGFSFATDAGQISTLRSCNVYGSLDLAAVDFRSTFGGTAIIEDCHFQNLGTATTDSLVRYDGTPNTGSIIFQNNVLEAANYFSLTATMGTSAIYTQAMYHNFVNCSSIGVLPTAVAGFVFNDTVCGNFWAAPDGSGWSQTNVDENFDGIIDLPYVISYDGTDYLPLASFPFDPNPTPPPTPTPTPTPTTTPTPPPSGGSGGGGGLPPTPNAPISTPSSDHWWSILNSTQWYIIIISLCFFMWAAIFYVLMLALYRRSRSRKNRGK